MKYHKLILIGTMMLTSVVSTQASVYGTLKQDMCFNVSDTEKIVKPSGMGISIVDEDDYNYLVRIDDQTSELVSKGLVEIQGTISKTKTSEAKVLEVADAEATVLKTLGCGELVMVLEQEDDFYKIKVNDTVGYIQNSDIENAKLASLSVASKQQTRGEEVIDYAKRYLGGPYVYGGNNLNTGVDCSGFTQQIMKHFDVSLERSSRAQYASNGYKVSKAELLPGDLIFYGYSGSINHVAIYAGNDQIIHASTERTGITMGSLHGNTPIIGMKRVI